MAHKILGIDLGAWSVKIAELEAGFRQSRLIGLYEKPLLAPEEGEDDIERRARTAAALIGEERLEAEMYSTSLGGEATLRLVTLPFADPRKIEQVLGYELESQILGDLDDLVIDHVVSTSKPGATNVIAVAAARDLVRRYVEALSSVGADPRVIGAAALSYAALRGHAFTDEVPAAIVDVGHRHTNFCLVRGSTVLFARSIVRGAEDVTLAFADAFKVDASAAERLKHEQATLMPGAGRAEEITRGAMRSLVRELRQTLAAYRAGGGDTPPERLILTGGGVRMRGAVEYLGAELGLPASRMELIPSDTFVKSDLRAFEGAREVLLPAQALGLALAAAAPVPQVNLRKGELAYRRDFSYLRGKAGYLAAAVLAILAFAALNAAASLRSLRKESEGLEARLRRETTELFGEARLDGKAVSEELRQGPKGGLPQIPTTTAFDVLQEISHVVPPGDKIKLDIVDLDIKPKKVQIKGTAESAQQVDDLVAAMQKIECFEDVQKGKVSSVTAPPSGDNPKGDKAAEVKQFTLTITTTCP